MKKPTKKEQDQARKFLKILAVVILLAGVITFPVPEITLREAGWITSTVALVYVVLRWVK